MFNEKMTEADFERVLRHYNMPAAPMPEGQTWGQMYYDERMGECLYIPLKNSFEAQPDAHNPTLRILRTLFLDLRDLWGKKA